MKKFTIGVDVGGTNVKLGLLDARGTIIARSRFATKAYVSAPAKLIAALAGEISALMTAQGVRASQVDGIGIGLPGLVDPERGVVIFLPNVPGWRQIPLRRRLEARLGIPVYLENDVNLITLGEWGFGAAEGCRNLICMTLGTGVGAGLMIEGRLYRGDGFVAGEIGHMPLNFKGPACNCGSFACFETYVGNGPLQKEAARVFRDPGITFEDIFSRARKGDAAAIGFWDAFGERVAAGLIGPVNLLNPSRVVIGGGIANNFRFFAPAVRRVLRRRAMPVQAKMVRVVRARLGDDAGLRGARVLVDNQQKVQHDA